MAKRAAGWSATAARELLARRLATQWIEPGAEAVPGPGAEAVPGSGGERVARVVRRLLAMQAQDFGQAVWAMGLRSPGSTIADVEAAFDSGAVVRSWPMRGTLHVSSPDDLRLMLSITAERTIRSTATRHRRLGLDDETFTRARELVTTELSGGGRATRDEVFALLSAHGIEPGGQRGTHVIGQLAHEGLICWGPTAGGRQQLVLLDEWAPRGHDAVVAEGSPGDPRRDEAVGVFLLRYLEGHGPATLKDFCWWSKVTVAEAARGLDLIRDRLEPVRLGDTDHYVAADSTAAVGEVVATTTPGGEAAVTPGGEATTTAAGALATSGRATGFHALPGFDEYLLGYPDRAPALAEEFAGRIVPGENGIFLPMLVAHGSVVGTWRRRITPTSVTVTIDPFRPLSATARTGFERALRRYARFQRLPLVLKEAGDA